MSYIGNYLILKPKMKTYWLKTLNLKGTLRTQLKLRAKSSRSLNTLQNNSRMSLMKLKRGNNQYTAVTTQEGSASLIKYQRVIKYSMRVNFNV